MGWVLLLRSGGCSSINTEATDPAPPLGLRSALLGNPLQRQAVAAEGRWSSVVTVRWHHFYTRERDASESGQRHLALDLRPDGSALACFSVTGERRSSTSHFETADHQDHRSTDRQEQHLGYTGRWQRVGAGVEVSLEGAVLPSPLGACGADGVLSPGAPLRLGCQGLAPTDRIAVPFIACLPIAGALPEGVGLDVGEEDAEATDLPVEVGRPPAGRWLVLAASPGLQVTLSKEGWDAEGSLELRASAPTAGAR